VSPSHSCLCVNTELPETKPSISVSPSEVIALGGAVTIRCQCRCEARRLFLYKGGIQIQELDAAGDGGEFTIPSARREDGGFYSCQSRSRSEPPNWSDPSEMVYPKPSISLRPSGGVALGGAVTVRCRGLYQNVRFLLYKDGKWTMLQDMDAAVDLVEFPIRNVSWRDAGSYSCYYCSKWYPFTWSHPSDPVELVVAGEGPGSVSPLPVAPGGAVTVRCECRCRGARFLLSKAGDLDARRATDSAGDVVEFPIRSVSQGDAGNYSCQYSTKWDPPIWSEPSDPVELVTYYPKPSISLSPRGRITLGGAVTVRCRGRHQSMRFLLYKDGNPNVLPKSDPPVWSHPGDSVELVVAGEGPGQCPRSQPHTQPDPQRGCVMMVRVLLRAQERGHPLQRAAGYGSLGEQAEVTGGRD
uniref:Ig-like domain-containing protein n=1 Tax=Chrysemys picta bellii TaxID=8478 RepID=A0A8C3HP87_CHRPI